ncbi:hypothetical protein ABL78_2840 [Leptomonas seymouri]|uniref:Uncharacterized protein n=1 Tax=Leptomonas seymouri TaxID=5684 RepID=A0A0N1PE46_LEPSE|nr:hypothetical protein ABL78_2840 [Leptomonas seymouri]|eukprot:KPI88064.1 hypothetical protein ABL78_2840 [Leptomonas seymouri]
MSSNSKKTESRQVSATASDSQRSTSPLNGGYGVPFGYCMFTMGGDEGEASASKNGGGDTFTDTMMMSSNALYNVPSYYEAGSYGGVVGCSGSHWVQSSRRLPGGAPRPRNSTDSGTGRSPSAVCPFASCHGRCPPAITVAGDSTKELSGYCPMVSSYDYHGDNDFYGASAGAAAGRRESDHNFALSRRSGGTTATSIEECHLSRKNSGGFTPRAENMFFQSQGSLSVRSSESRADRSAISDVGSAFDAAYYANLVSQGASDAGFSQHSQRRLSGSFRKEQTLSSTTAQNSSGDSLPPPSKEDHAVPIISPSCAHRPVTQHPPTKQSANSPKSTACHKRVSTATREEELGLKSPHSCHSYSCNYGEAGCPPLYDLEGDPTGNAASSAAASEVVAPAANASAARSASSALHASSQSPPKVAVGLRSPLRPGGVLTSRIVVPQPATAVPLLPNVPGSSPILGPRASLSNQLEMYPLTAVQKADATAKQRSGRASPIIATLKERDAACAHEPPPRSHLESASTASSNSVSSGSRHQRTPPPRKQPKITTASLSRHTGTVLPPTLSTAALVESSRSTLCKNDEKPTTKATAGTVPTMTSAAVFTANATTAPSQPPPSQVKLSQALKEQAVESADPLLNLVTFKAAPPTERRNPNRFFRRHHLIPPAVPLSATEISTPQAPSPQASNRKGPLLAGLKAPSGFSPAKALPSGNIRGGSLSLNISSTVINNLVGDGGGDDGGGARNGSVGGEREVPPSVSRRIRRPFESANIVPLSGCSEAVREPNLLNGRVSRNRSGSETHSLTDVVGNAQTRSCPSLDLSLDDVETPYLPCRSSSWSGHSTTCSSDSGDCGRNWPSRGKRQQDRVLPTTEEEVERLNNPRFTIRL